MYGYIQVCKPEMKFREFDEYCANYCGLCRSLRENFGISGRFFLSFDFTFLTLLLTGLYEPEEQRCSARCMAHPLKKQAYVCSDVSSYCADMCMLLSAYKLKDDWNDERSYFKKILSCIMSGKNTKLQKKYSDKTKVIEAELEKLNILEKEKFAEPEMPASCFGRIMAEIMAYKNDVWEEKLRDIGFHMGRFIYLADAFDDLPKDRNKKCYNPFLPQNEHDPKFIENTENLLRMMIAPAASAFEYLPIIKNADILRNILYAGVWTKFNIRKKEYLGKTHTKTGEKI